MCHLAREVDLLNERQTNSTWPRFPKINPTKRSEPISAGAEHERCPRSAHREGSDCDV